MAALRLLLPVACRRPLDEAEHVVLPVRSMPPALARSHYRQSNEERI
jgi:hypothetical protein